MSSSTCTRGIDRDFEVTLDKGKRAGPHPYPLFKGKTWQDMDIYLDELGPEAVRDKPYYMHHIDYHTKLNGSDHHYSIRSNGRYKVVNSYSLILSHNQ